MSIALAIIDAFADGPFTGNPAAVCLLPGPRPDTWMQQVAREMNLSETAFVDASDDAGAGDARRLRWFTPTTEVALCGHATLATAHVLWERGLLAPADSARFETRSGQLSATRLDDGTICLDLPAMPVAALDPPPGLIAALGVTPTWTGRNAADYLVEVADETAVRQARPDMAQLRLLPVRGVIITSRAAAPGYDLVSRFFAPGSGIDEDPVTGSAHCALAPYWSRRLGRTALVARQLSARGGTLQVTDQGDRIVVAGRAVTVVRGELAV